MHLPQIVHKENSACTRGEILSRRSMSLHGHGDERWPIEMTSNTHFRSVAQKGHVYANNHIINPVG